MPIIGRAGARAARFFFVAFGKRLPAVAVTLFVFTALMSGCSGTPSTVSSAPGSLTTVPSDYAGKTNPLGSDSVSAGAEVFKTNCVSCHGEKGLGDGPASQALDPKPANLVQLNKVAGDDFLFWRISTGVGGTVMPAWKGVLSNEQIWQVISFIRTLK